MPPFIRALCDFSLTNPQSHVRLQLLVALIFKRPLQPEPFRGLLALLFP